MLRTARPKAHMTKDRYIEAFDRQCSAAMNGDDFGRHETLGTKLARTVWYAIKIRPRRGGRAAECGGLLNRFRD
jgi:hypothetical protein